MGPTLRDFVTPEKSAVSTRSESETLCPICERAIREDDLYEDGCPFCGTWIEEATDDA